MSKYLKVLSFIVIPLVVLASAYFAVQAFTGPSGSVGVGSGVVAVYNNNVGIGTTSPASALTVVGGSATSASSSLNVTNSNGSSILFVRDDGNIGIKNSSPAYNLDVNGSSNISGSLTVGGSLSAGNVTTTNLTATTLTVGNASTTNLSASNQITIGTTTITTNSYNGFVGASNVSSGAFGSNTGGGNYSFPGNVGIGTASPSASSSLDVVATNNSYPQSYFPVGPTISNYTNSSNSTSSGASLFLRTARGTLSSPSMINPGENIGNIVFGGYDSTGLVYNDAMISAYGKTFIGGGDPSLQFSVGFVAPTPIMTLTTTSVGIGTTAPAAPLTVVSGLSRSIQIGNSSYGNIIRSPGQELALNYGSGGNLDYYGGGTASKFLVDTNGNVTVGGGSINLPNSSSIYNGSGFGLVFQNANQTLGFWGYNPSNGIPTSNNSVVLDVYGCVNAFTSVLGPCPSDRRLKTNIKPINNILGKFINLQPVSFEWKTNTSTTNYGLIAQDVEKIFPELVTTGKNGYKQVTYGNELWMMNIEAVKEQQAEIDSLKSIVCSDHPTNSYCAAK